MRPFNSSTLVPFILLTAVLFTSCNVAGYDNLEGILYEKGIASWYGEDYHGGLTANGEIYDMEALTAAHLNLPFNSMVRVLNLENGKTVVVRINDRGPYVGGRVIDLSRRAAREIGIIETGLAEVEIYLLDEG